MSSKPQFQSNLDVIKRLASQRGTDFEYSGHADEEMASDHIDKLDLRNSLMNASNVIEQFDEIGPKFVVTGKDTNERVITSVIRITEIPPEVFVITVWEVKRR